MIERFARYRLCRGLGIAVQTLPRAESSPDGSGNAERGGNLCLTMKKCIMGCRLSLPVIPRNGELDDVLYPLLRDKALRESS